MADRSDSSLLIIFFLSLNFFFLNLGVLLNCLTFFHTNNHYEASVPLSFNKFIFEIKGERKKK